MGGEARVGGFLKVISFGCRVQLRGLFYDDAGDGC
jgi:hypothetical protein